LEDSQTPVNAIEPSTIEKYKVDRRKKIVALKQARGGSSIALDIAVLHRMFNFAVSKQMIVKKPIDLRNESKPGKNPKNGARPFNAEELTRLRESAGEDMFMVLLLRWTGLRGSDALGLRWENVHFNRGTNGEIEVMTQKRSKLAIIPLSTQLRDALEEVPQARQPRKDDRVLYNPETEEPFTSRKRLYERAKALGVRARQARHSTLLPGYACVRYVGPWRGHLRCSEDARGHGRHRREALRPVCSGGARCGATQIWIMG
jgi:integrase